MAGRKPNLGLGLLTVEADVSPILDHLYLGAKAVSEDREVLDKYAIGAIVNCTMHEPCYFKDSGIRYIRVEVTDEVESDITPYLESAADFIEEACAADAKVLVHCTMGMSRSTTVVIAYLMKYRGMGLAQAIQHTKERRPVASPNTGFMRQLIKYEQRLFGRCTVSMERYQADRFGDVSSFRTDGEEKGGGK